MNSNFQEIFSNAAYQTTGKLLSSQTFCHTDVKKMFLVINLEQGKTLLNMATVENQFHPDNIQVYSNILKEREAK